MVFLLAFVSEICAFEAKGTVWPNQSKPLGGPYSIEPSGLTAASTLQIRVRQDRGSVTPIGALRWANEEVPFRRHFQNIRTKLVGEPAVSDRWMVEDRDSMRSGSDFRYSDAVSKSV